MFQAPGEHVVALVPVAGPVPPPIMVVTPFEMASKICCGRNEMDVSVQRAGGHDQVLAGDHFGGRADHQLGVDSVHGVGIARLAHLDDAAVTDTDVAFDNAPMIDDQSVSDD